MPETPVAAASPSTDLYASDASNVDILNSFLDDEPAPTDGGQGDAGGGAKTGDSSTDGGAAAAGDVSAAKDGAAVAVEEPAPEWLESAPQDIRDILASKGISAAHKAFLTKTYEELLELKAGALGTPEAVGQLNDLFPGGVEDVVAAHENAQTFVREREQFASADPEQQAELLTTMLQESPDAFVQSVGVGLDLLKQTLRDDYTQIASGVAREHIESISNGKFASFFDGVASLVEKYNQTVDSNPEAAAKIASQLAGAALNMASWWNDSKERLGFTKEGAAAAAPGGRAPIIPFNKPNDAEMSMALREANLFQQNLAVKHDAAIDPIIDRMLSKELTARSMNLPASWSQQVRSTVAKAIVKNLQDDRQFQALLNREYHRGTPKDPRKWAKTDAVGKFVVNAARQRAERIIPALLKKALDRIGEIYGKPAKAAAPAAGLRGGGSPRQASSTLGDEDFKNPDLSDQDLLKKMLA